MKKLALLVAATCLASQAYAANSLDVRIAKQGDHTGVTLDYVGVAPSFVPSVKNAYYELKAERFSGTTAGIDSSLTLFGASYGLSDAINEQFEWFGQLGLSYAIADVDLPGVDSESEVDLLMRVGVEADLNKDFYYKAYVAAEEGETGVGFDINYNYSAKVKIVGAVEAFDETRYMVGVHYYF